MAVTRQICYQEVDCSILSLRQQETHNFPTRQSVHLFPANHAHAYTGALSDAATVRPSVSPPVYLSAPYPWLKNGAFYGYGYRTHRAGSRSHWSAWTSVAEAATKPSPAPLQKHSLGGCTVDMSPCTCHRRTHIVSPRDTR